MRRTFFIADKISQTPNITITLDGDIELWNGIHLFTVFVVMDVTISVNV